MPTVIVNDPRGAGANTIYGVNFGVATSHDPGVAYDAVYYGLGGSDYIYGTDANEWYWGGYGDASPVQFFAGGGSDVLVGFDGADALYGGAGDDVLIGNAGNDALNGQDGFDQLWGGSGHDNLDGGNGPDWVIGGGGGLAPALPDRIGGGNKDGARDILIGADGSFDLFITSANSFYDPASGSATDIAWYFKLGEDRIYQASDDSYAGGTQYYGNWAGTGLSGTLIYSNNNTGDPVIFLAGVNVTYAQLVAAGSFGYV